VACVAPPGVEEAKVPTRRNALLKAHQHTATSPDVSPLRLGQLLASFLHRLRLPASALALACCFALAVPQAAHAARSGGRMGGSSFRSSSSSSFSSMGSYSSLGGGSSLHTHLHSGVSRGYQPLRTSGFFLMPFGGFYGGGGALNLILFAGVVAYFVMQSGILSNGATSEDGGASFGATDRVAVLRLQVGLLGLARELQQDLNSLAERADTSSPAGLQRVLQETTLALLRHPEFCVYGSSGGKQCSSVEQAESRFNEVSLEERSKLAQETLVNAGGKKRRTSTSTSGGGRDEGTNEFIVVTILVAADGPLKLPPVKSLEDLQTALRRLGSVRQGALQAVEVLWTPQEEGDTLTQQELTSAYPTLNSL
jgi:uncharacterized membrane protein